MKGERLLLWVMWCCLLCSLTKVQSQSQESTDDGPSDDDIKEAFDQAAGENENSKRSSAAPEQRGSATPATQEDSQPVESHNFFQQPTPDSTERAESQKPFEGTTRVLTKTNNLSPQAVNKLPEKDLKPILGSDDEALKRCEDAHKIKKCDKYSRYRTMDGSCNNLGHPSWGMTNVCFQRLLKPSYSDGISEYRKSCSGKPLPMPREISLKIHSHLDKPSRNITHMFMVWGQFLDHDISLSPLYVEPATKKPPSCCDKEPGNRHPECMPIIMKDDDKFYSNLSITCLDNVRTQACSTCRLGPRQQPNTLTAYIDGSAVYGTSENQSRSLRTFHGGRLLSQMNHEAGELCPGSFTPDKDRCSFRDDEKKLKCFQTGDPRANQHPALTGHHIVFLREHNRIAKKLAEMNPHWNDEKLYQEIRRIVGAEIQMITYKEFLPLLIGHEKMKRFGLTVGCSGYTQYDKTDQPTLLNEFSTAAYRCGHSMINSFFSEIESHKVTRFRLKNIFQFPFGIYKGQLERVMLGLTDSPSQKFDRHMVEDVTNHVYQSHKGNFGLDLASMNILRGRDHGLRSYTDYVKFCHGPNITSFRQLDRIFQRGVSHIFEKIYECPQDIDLFTGGLAERTLPGAFVGPTFACILGIQFYLQKYGDRFYCEHKDQTGSFTEDQLAELRKITFAKIICQNTKIKKIQKHCMSYADDRNPVQHCDDLPEMCLEPWREKKKC